MARPTKKAKEAAPARSYLVPVEAYGAPLKTKDRPSWIQFISSRLATGLLIYLCAVSAFFIGIWAWTLPSIADLQITKTQGIDVDKVFERFYAARRSHFNDIRDMYLLVMGNDPGACAEPPVRPRIWAGAGEWAGRRNQREHLTPPSGCCYKLSGLCNSSSIR